MLYEKGGLFTTHRTPTNRRLYSQNDLKTIHFIKYLTQQKNINLKGVALVFKAMEISRKNGWKLRRALFPDYISPKNLLS